MGLKRGEWKPETYNTTTEPRVRKFGARPAVVNQKGMSNSEHHLRTRESQPMNIISTGVSDHRAEELIRATENTQSGQSISPSPVIVNSGSYKWNKELWKRHEEMLKTADVPETSNLLGGGSNVVRQAPEVYSPLFQIANLQLPRNRITMNAWNRNFYSTHPLVHNGINLHATYPINKINIKCKDRKIENFFNELIEEIDLIGVLQAMSLEFWELGEVFPHLELDPGRGVWKNVVIHNPDYVHVKTSVIGGDPIISLKPDAALQRLVQSSNPADIKIRNQIDPEVMHYLKKGQNIPLDNFHVSHLKMTKSPYDIHGTSIIVSIYKDLMHFDKLRECLDITTEILTDSGICRGLDAIEYDNINGEIKNVRIKDGIKIACFNPETEEIEYHRPTGVHLSHYKGEMYHFNGKKIDVMTTPNHRMWLKTRRKKGWDDWHFEYASDVSKAYYHKFRSWAKWSGINKESVSVCGNNIPTKDYLKFLGYVISEGCVYQNYIKGKRSDNKIILSQLTQSKYYQPMRDNMEKIASNMSLHCGCYIRTTGSGYSKDTPKEKWEGKICNKQFTDHLIEEVGIDGKCNSYNKRIPRWILELSPDLLKIILNSLVDGDGSVVPSKYKNSTSSQFRYSTVCKQLADDVYELVYKCGYVPNLYQCKRANKDFIEYIVLWSDTNYGNEPLVYGNPDYNGANIDKVDYNDLVWCFEVPTGLFMIRRNGKISVQGNSKFAQADGLVNPITLITVGGNNDGEYRATDDDLEKWRQTFESAQYDRDFKIISHAGVDIKRVGASGAIIDIANDINQILDNILYGLMIPKSVITQEGSSFSNASIGLEILKQRYEAFRNMMAQWLIKKFFAPISELHEFYKYEDGHKKLILPEIEWNKMILFDMDNYINILAQQVQSKAVSKTTLFRSLGLNIEEEDRLIREENIKEHIKAKENMILQTMNLGALRALKSDEDIIEPTEAPLPGTPGAGEESGVPGAMPGGGMGGMPGGLTPPAAPPMGGGGGGGALPLEGPGGGELGMPPAIGPGAGGPTTPGPGGGAGAGGGGTPPI